MMLEDRWRDIDNLLKVKNLKVSEAERLRGHIAALLTVPDHRESLLERLNRKQFPGRKRFLQELVPALDPAAPALSELPSEDRHRLRLALIDATHPKSDRAHWDFLWQMERDGDDMAARRIVDSLIAVAGRKKEISAILVTLPWWDEFPRDRAAALLEAACRAPADAETTRRIEQAREWVKRLSPDGNGPPPPELPGPEKLASGAGPVPLADAELSSCLAAVTQYVTDLHGRHTEARRRLDQELSDERARHRQEAEVLREQLRLAEEAAQVRLRQLDSLEQDLARREKEQEEAREEMERLTQQAAQHRNEVEAVERRTADYIHQANLEKENALRTFQAELWNRLHLCLVEVLDGEAERANLTPDQAFFLRRLREIKEALREFRVPPY
jgi:hypothetical protein